MWPSAWPARPETVRQSTPPATSWVTMKWRRSCRRQLTPSRRARRRNRWEMPSGLRNGDPALGVGLGVLVDQGLLGDADHVAGDQDLDPVKVDVGPAQRAQLAAAGTEHDGEAQ